jgi:hypothetical protein
MISLLLFAMAPERKTGSLVLYTSLDALPLYLQQRGIDFKRQ